MKIKTSQIENFIGCEYGAHEDDMRGPSPLTTVEILERSKAEIVINTAEEAAQIADCCRYGTFSHHHPRAAAHVFEMAISYTRAREIMDKWDSEQWEGLAQLVEDSRK
jgi:hypothetical protein